MLVRIKYTRNGLTTTKDLKNTKRPHLMKQCQKPKTSYSQRKRCRKPKRPLAVKRFEKTPFGVALQRLPCLYYTLKSACRFEPFGVYIPLLNSI